MNEWTRGRDRERDKCSAVAQDVDQNYAICSLHVLYEYARTDGGDCASGKNITFLAASMTQKIIMVLTETIQKKI